MHSDGLTTTISSRQLVRGLWLIVAILVVLTAAVQWIELTWGRPSGTGWRHALDMFNVVKERNVPTYFSSLLLLLAALILALIARHKRRAYDAYARHWAGLSLIFLYLSFDEFAQVHERLIKPMRSLFDAHGVFYFAWVIPAIVLLVVFALAYLRFLFHLPARAKRWFVLAAVLYIAGAIGLEMLGGDYAEGHGFGGVLYRVYSTIEETLEMAGTIVFIYALLDYLGTLMGELRVRIIPSR